jgi:hypothetical protein
MEKAVSGLVMVLMATTLVLPHRQTPAVIEKFFNGISKLSKTAIGQG